MLHGYVWVRVCVWLFQGWLNYGCGGTEVFLCKGGGHQDAVLQVWVQMGEDRSPMQLWFEPMPPLLRTPFIVLVPFFWPFIVIKSEGKLHKI